MVEGRWARATFDPVQLMLFPAARNNKVSRSRLLNGNPVANFLEFLNWLFCPMWVLLSDCVRTYSHETKTISCNLNSLASSCCILQDISERSHSKKTGFILKAIVSTWGDHLFFLWKDFSKLEISRKRYSKVSQYTPAIVHEKEGARFFMSCDRFESVVRESMYGTISFSRETDDGERGRIILASPVVDAKDISCLTVDRRSTRLKEIISVSSGLSLLGLAAKGLRALLSSCSGKNQIKSNPFNWTTILQVIVLRIHRQIIILI